MPRGTTLANLLTMLKAEVGDYSGTNSTRDAELKVLLANKQKILATEHFWPFLYPDWDVTFNAGDRFKTLPTQTASNPANETAVIDLDKLPIVTVYQGGHWNPVIYGIGPDEYNTFDFANDGTTSTPIQRWRLATNTNESNAPNQYEVWPVPSETQVLRFTGKRQLQALTSDSHTADLDDLLLVLFVAADILTRKKQPDATLKLQQANRRLSWLRQGINVKDVRRTLDNNDAQQPRTVGIRIAVA